VSDFLIISLPGYYVDMEIALDQLEQFAKDFVNKLPEVVGGKAHVVGLKGNLGAGKTTFVQEVAGVLGVEKQVTSPTFVIAQSYETKHPVFKRLVHMDAYRLSEEVVDTIGFSEYMSDPHTLVLVEWPENLPKEAEFPKGAPILEFETVDEETRKIVEHA
jgi:tRNA threonylcarbamoyladenosine biosynthesis protein TsaE